MDERPTPCDTVYDLAFLEAALDALGAMDFESQLCIPDIMESFRENWDAWFVWFSFHAYELLPDGHPFKQRLYPDNDDAYTQFLPAPDDRDGWQVLRDTVADLAVVYFVSSFPKLTEHPLTVGLAESLGIGRWFALAREDTGGPAQSTFISYAPYGCNWERECLPRYTYPVPLDITVEACMATFAWLAQMKRHLSCALQEVYTIQQCVEKALDELGFDLAALEGSRAHTARGFDQPFATPVPTGTRPRLLDRAFGSATPVARRLQEAIPAHLTGTITDIATAFDLFWWYWSAWYPVRVETQYGTPIRLSSSASGGFPPAPEDEAAWCMLANTLGDVPLARFCYWFGAVTESAWTRATAAELGITDRLDDARRHPGRPSPGDAETPALVSTGWELDPGPLPPPSAVEMQATFVWLEKTRQQMRAVLQLLVG